MARARSGMSDTSDEGRHNGYRVAPWACPASWQTQVALPALVPRISPAACRPDPPVL